MATPYRKKRQPKLSHTTNRNYGYFVSYRDAAGTPRKHRFGNIPRSEALAAYDAWLAKFLAGDASTATVKVQRAPARPLDQAEVPEQPSGRRQAAVTVGSLAHITLEFLKYEESRIRPDNGPRVKNTIEQKEYNTRKKFALSFLASINKQREESGAVNRMRLADLTMQEVEAFNKELADNAEADSTVTKTMQAVKKIIDTGGRPELGQQNIAWNWDSRRKYFGKPQIDVVMPTLRQLKLVLQKCKDDTARTCQIWMALGLAFGQSDLADSCSIHFDEVSYDCRRGKTYRDRYGEMPPLVWRCIQNYLRETPRPKEERLFLTQRKRPLVEGNNDSIQLWWNRLRKSLGDDCKSMNGFYSLRHLAATAFGSRPGCSLSAMRTFLGHSLGSEICDGYMRPLAPEHKEAVAWVRNALQTCRVNLKL